MQFYSYDIMCHETNHLLMCKHLFQQFIVDGYCKVDMVEMEQLQFLRREQITLRADNYSNQFRSSQPRSESDTPSSPPNRLIIRSMLPKIRTLSIAAVTSMTTAKTRVLMTWMNTWMIRYKATRDTVEVPQTKGPMMEIWLQPFLF